jgi:two-component system nitrogen regulation response regulator NtrX
MALDILIIDDEDDIRDLIAGILEDEGYETRQAHDADSGLAEIARRRPSLVFLDIWMQGSRLDGLQLLDVFQSQHPDMPVVMISRPRSPPSGAAPTITSRSRSRSTGCC